MVRKIVLFILLTITLTAVATARPGGVEKTAGSLPLPAAQYKEDEILIQFDESVSKGKLNSAAVDSQVRLFAASHQLEVKKAINHGWHCFKLPAGQTVPQAMASLKNNQMVKKIEPNYIIRAAALSTTYTPTGAFNDTLYTDGSSQWWLNRTKADQAYNAGYVFEGTSDVIVAVVDTGVDLDHAEFSGRLVTGYNVIAPASDPEDDNDYTSGLERWGHGTHVAGMIAANVNNSSGIAGTAWSGYIKIMPIKALDSDGSGSISDYAAGIDWAVANGASVINLSVDMYTTASPSLLETAISDAVSAGCLVVAAAGNSNRDINASPYCYPAIYSDVFTVGATTSDDYVTYYSNYSFTGGILDVVAPGGAMIEYASGWEVDYGVTTTANTGAWTPLDGTSFAAPQASALAAMLWLQVPSRTADEIKTIIRNTTEDNASEAWQFDGSGKIDVLAALGVYQTPTPTPTYTPTYTRTVTATITPSYTRTPTHSPTSTISPTATPTPSPTSTMTVTPTFTRTVTPTITLTATESVTMTPTFTHTTTYTETATPTITLTATESTTPTPTFTRTVTPTITRTATESASPTPTFSHTATYTPTRTATASATMTHTPTLTSTFTITPTFTATLTATASASPTPTSTITLTATESATPTRSVTITHTPTVTPTYTHTLTLTYTSTFTPTNTMTITETMTPTFTPTMTPTVTPTYTVSATYTVTPTLTGSPTHVITKTATATRTMTTTSTFTATPTVRLPSENISGAVVFPNPWRGDVYQHIPRVVFARLPVNTTIVIYTVDGKMIKKIEPGTIDDGGRTNNPGGTGRVEWGLTNTDGEDISSGIYIYIARDEEGNQVIGKIAIIR